MDALQVDLHDVIPASAHAADASHSAAKGGASGTVSGPSTHYTHGCNTMEVSSPGTANLQFAGQEVEPTRQGEGCRLMHPSGSASVQQSGRAEQLVNAAVARQSTQDQEANPTPAGYATRGPEPPNIPAVAITPTPAGESSLSRRATRPGTSEHVPNRNMGQGSRSPARPSCLQPSSEHGGTTATLPDTIPSARAPSARAPSTRRLRPRTSASPTARGMNGHANERRGESQIQPATGSSQARHAHVSSPAGSSAPPTQQPSAIHVVGGTSRPSAHDIDHGHDHRQERQQWASSPTSWHSAAFQQPQAAAPFSNVRIFAFDDDYNEDPRQRDRVQLLRANRQGYWEEQWYKEDVQTATALSLQDQRVQQQDTEMVDLLKAMQAAALAPQSGSSQQQPQENGHGAGSTAASSPHEDLWGQCMPASWFLLDLLHMVEDASVYAAAQGDDNMISCLVQMTGSLDRADSPRSARDPAIVMLCDLMLHVHRGKGIIDLQDTSPTTHGSLTMASHPPSQGQLPQSSQPSKLEDYLRGHIGAIVQASGLAAALTQHEQAQLRLAKVIAPLVMEMAWKGQPVDRAQSSSGETNAKLPTPSALGLASCMFGDSVEALEQWLLASGHAKDFCGLQCQQETWQRLQQKLIQQAAPPQPRRTGIQQSVKDIAKGAKNFIFGSPPEDQRNGQHQPQRTRAPATARRRVPHAGPAADTALLQGPFHASGYADGFMQRSDAHSANHALNAALTVPDPALRGLQDIHRLTSFIPRPPTLVQHGHAGMSISTFAPNAAPGGRMGSQAPTYSQMVMGGPQAAGPHGHHDPRRCPDPRSPWPYQVSLSRLSIL